MNVNLVTKVFSTISLFLVGFVLLIFVAGHLQPFRGVVAPCCIPLCTCCCRFAKDWDSEGFHSRDQPFLHLQARKQINTLLSLFTFQTQAKFPTLIVKKSSFSDILSSLLQKDSQLKSYISCPFFCFAAPKRAAFEHQLVSLMFGHKDQT